jgi:signal transduction histidine kinase/CheY-like chemotaxis protein
MSPTVKKLDSKRFSFVMLFVLAIGITVVSIVQYHSLQQIESLIVKNCNLLEMQSLNRWNKNLKPEQDSYGLKPELKARHRLIISLQNKITTHAHEVRDYGNFMIVLFVMGSGILIIFTIVQFKKQNLHIDEMRRSQNKIKETLELKEKFLANMSHEIRTPLNAILGFTNLLRRKEIEVEAKEFVGAIQVSSENLLTIVNDILDFSKIEAGMLRIVREPFALVEVLHCIEVIFSQQAKEKGLCLTFNVASNIPAMVNGDACRLKQILVNIVGNAMKFTSRGKVTVSVCAKIISGQELELDFCVTDSGIGIEQKKIDAIFDRFDQGCDGITREYGGTGLGISIVKNLVELQQGTICVTSCPGYGTSFYFQIPYTVAEIEIPEVPVSAFKVLQKKLHRSMRLLVVEDNIMNQCLIEHTLQERSINFQIVSSGIEAIELLKGKTFDMILMDIQMPGMDGYSATHFIREHLKLTLPIIAMSAHAMAGEHEKSMLNGMNGYISKPIQEEELFDLIQSLHNCKRAHNPGNYLKTGYNYIDTRYITEIAKGNLQYQNMVVSQFVECTLFDIADLQMTLLEEDYREIGRIAHNMKTSAGIIGLLPKVKVFLNNLEFPGNDYSEFSTTMEELIAVCRLAIDEAYVFLEVIASTNSANN